MIDDLLFSTLQQTSMNRSLKWHQVAISPSNFSLKLVNPKPSSPCRLRKSQSTFIPPLQGTPVPVRSMSSSQPKRSPLALPNDESQTNIYGDFPAPTLERAKEVTEKMNEVENRVQLASQKSGRQDKLPRLVAISKLHPPSSILAAHLHTGQRHFGENYVQELVEKAKVLPSDAENGIRWHFVGGLQSNKGKLLASIPNLYLLETLDSIKASNVLEKALSSPDSPKRSDPLFVYLQVNTSGEEVKSGLSPILNEGEGEGSKPPQDSERPLFDLAKHVILNCPNLKFKGLMTIGSAANSTNSSAIKNEDLETTGVQEILKVNPDFDKLIQTRKNLVDLLRRDAELDREEIVRNYPQLLSRDQGEEEGKGGLELSMGMSADLELAIKVGSDNVRVGTDCFGRRMGSRDEAMKAMQHELKSKEN